MNTVVRFIAISALILIGTALLFWGAINIYVNAYASKYILTAGQASDKQLDAVIVLGAKVAPTGRPGYMLQSRLDMGIKLYNNHGANKLLLSGDHGNHEYNEVGGMYLYTIEKGVPKDDIFLDHAGFSTYETARRAKEVFDCKSAIVVTQKYHLSRTVYCARMSGINAYGVASDNTYWRKMPYYVIRESIAVCKDFFVCLFKPDPTYLGEAIPITGSGVSTHDIENNKYIKD